MSSGIPSFLTFQQRLRNPTAQWAAARWQMLCDLRVAAPGIVQSFDAARQTASVKVAVTENILDPGTLAPTPEEIPLLTDVPVVLYRAGGYVLTLPIAAGDECLLIFGDSDYSAWWQSGGVQNQIVRRRHDLSDSFAIVGLWSQPNAVAGYSTDSVQLRSVDGTRKVEVGADISIAVTGAKVNVTSDTEIDVSAPTVKIEGGGTSIDAKNFLNHKHSGVTTGGGQSGPVA